MSRRHFWRTWVIRPPNKSSNHGNHGRIVNKQIDQPIHQAHESTTPTLGIESNRIELNQVQGMTGFWLVNKLGRVGHL